MPHQLFALYKPDRHKSDGANLHAGYCLEDAWWNYKPLTYMNLGNNSLSSVPEDVGMFESLINLNLQNNSLSSLPSSIAKLTKLKMVNISKNKFEVVPEVVYSLKNLESLCLANNQIAKLDRNLSNLTELRELDISNNKLEELSAGLGKLTKLVNLDLSGNELLEIPSEILNLQEIHKLDLTNNNLKRLPTIKKLSKLRCLYATHNDIEEIPDFEDCGSIEELYFGNNFIKTIRKSFCEFMGNLRVLELRDNKIVEIPEDIIKLQQLIKLDLTNNDLRFLPNSLGFLTELQKLYIDGNPLRSIRQQVIRGGTERVLKYLRDKVKDEDVPKIIALKYTDQNQMSRINQTFPDKFVIAVSRSLNLSMRNLCAVPESIFKTALSCKITTVDLSKNKLSEIPRGLWVLARMITTLKLGNNQLTALTPSIYEYENLQILELEGNMLSNLPEELGMLKFLRELNIGDNVFVRIPNCVYELKKLQILLVANNRLEQLDVKNLGNLKILTHLDVSNNNIRHIPPELGNLTQLKHLVLKGNGFRNPRYAVLQQGTEAVLAYLRNKIEKVEKDV